MRLLTQISEIKKTYLGNNKYHIYVADSDTNNTEFSLIESKCDARIINPGSGFDDNILNFYDKYINNFEYTLSISDDDLFNTSQINPFHILDAALKSHKPIILFNH